MDRRLIAVLDDWQAIRERFRWPDPLHFNIAERCCDSWAAAEPGRVAIVHLGDDGAEQRWTYGALKEASDRLAASFAARGLRRGDRVAVLLPQRPEVLVTHFAAMKLGAVVLPLFVLFGEDALRFRLADSGAKMVVTDAENLPKIEALRADLPELAEIYSVDGAAPPIRDLAAEMASYATGIAPVRTLAEDPAVLIYTSGTTGPPKGALHAHRFLIGHLPSLEVHHTGLPQPGDCGWTPADWAWIGGLMDMAMPCLYYGIPLISRRFRRFDPEAAFRLIRETGARNLFLPPTALKLMRQVPVPQGVNIRTISSGGEALGADLLDWGLTSLGAPINEIYGQTECNLVLASCHGLMEIRPGSMGHAVPGFDVAILDRDGQELGPGETGEIAVRAPNPVMFLGYWQQPEKTAQKYRDGWLVTGDLGVRDADGYFTFVARDDDVITTSGYRVGPSEIEGCLNAHPDVVMAAVVGVPDPVRTEAIKAFVVARPGTGTDELAADLVARVRERLSPHLVPRQVEFVADLPMTATGKIMRRSLRERG